MRMRLISSSRCSRDPHPDDGCGSRPSVAIGSALVECRRRPASPPMGSASLFPRTGTPASRRRCSDRCRGRRPTEVTRGLVSSTGPPIAPMNAPPASASGKFDPVATPTIVGLVKNSLATSAAVANRSPPTIGCALGSARCAPSTHGVHGRVGKPGQIVRHRRRHDRAIGQQHRAALQCRGRAGRQARRRRRRRWRETRCSASLRTEPPTPTCRICSCRRAARH